MSATTEMASLVVIGRSLTLFRSDRLLTIFFIRSSEYDSDDNPYRDHRRWCQRYVGAQVVLGNMGARRHERTNRAADCGFRETGRSWGCLVSGDLLLGICDSSFRYDTGDAKSSRTEFEDDSHVRVEGPEGTSPMYDGLRTNLPHVSLGSV